jgi:6-phosphofructokinase 1
MNACIRAVVRTAAARGLTCLGVRDGLQGLVDDNMQEMSARDVSGIVHCGGTVLGTARCQAFYKQEGRSIAARHVRAHGIDALVIIGGDGSFSGGYALYSEHGIPFMGLPGTIDNDMYGTDYTIGFATAVNTAVQAVDRIRDTAESHRRLFFIEVMGRHCGAIAMYVALATGAEEVLIPEVPTDLDVLAARIIDAKARGKRSFIVIVAEGDDAGNAIEIAAKVESMTSLASRVCILGHVQRGGSPSAFDRAVAAILGNAAVEALVKGKVNMFVGMQAGEVAFTSVTEVVANKKTADISLEELTRLLAT